jgi:hypothetical protein
MNPPDNQLGLELFLLLLWCLAIVSVGISSDRLKDAIPPEEEERWRGLHSGRRNLDLLEGPRWYIRSRSLARAHRADGGDIGLWSGRLFRSMQAAEIVGVLLVALLIATFPADVTQSTPQFRDEPPRRSLRLDHEREGELYVNSEAVFGRGSDAGSQAGARAAGEARRSALGTRISNVRTGSLRDRTRSRTWHRRFLLKRS